MKCEIDYVIKEENTILSNDNILEKMDLCTMYYYLSFIDETFYEKGMFILKEINTNMELLSPSPIYGYSRLGYLSSAFSNNGGNYKQFTSQIDKIVRFQTTQIIKLIEEKNYINHRVYDLFNGICGIGRYLLKNNQENTEVLNKILSVLIKLSSPYTIGQKKINNFFISPSNIIDEKKLKLFPKGYLDLGLSHGIAGVLMFLILCFKKNIILPGQEAAIKSILNIYKENICYKENNIFWPKFIAPIIKESELSYNIRPSWCYGNASIAWIIYLASKIINDVESQKLSLAVINNIISKKINDLNFISPTFCHGYAGLYHIMNLFFKETHETKFENYAKNLRKKIFAFIDYDYNLLFKNYELKENYKIETEESTSIINGAFSVLIPLLIDEYKIDKNDIFSEMLFLK